MEIFFAVTWITILITSIVIVSTTHNLAAQSWLLAFLICLSIATFISLGGTLLLGTQEAEVVNNIDSFLLINSIGSVFNACAWLFLLRFIIILRTSNRTN